MSMMLVIIDMLENMPFNDEFRRMKQEAIGWCYVMRVIKVR
ncbi:hypothetical protein [Photobacterium marinum]|nr:hypothetical protein [Photobacterium marinum]